MWLSNIRREDLYELSVEELNKSKRYVVCDLHFGNNSFNQPLNRYSSKLRCDAVPCQPTESQCVNRASSTGQVQTCSSETHMVIFLFSLHYLREFR
jgi:hypothetical protein